MKFTVSNSLRMLRDPDLNLVFLHIATPHPAGIWDTRAKRYTLEDSDYVDNLALADKTLGDFRRLMEQLGEWDRTTVLISGDHPYRTGMWMDSSIWTEEMARLTRSRWHPYVPFFLKLPGQHSGVEYTTEFNNVLSGDLALDILKRQLKTPEEVVSWLNAHAAASLH
jgi:arylsulfatase A-like enzyme